MTKNNITSALTLAAPLVAALTPLASMPATAQQANFPSRPITIVVAMPASGTADFLSRLIAPILTYSLGVAVIIDNRPGASGAIGASVVARAKPDGHTLLVVTPNILSVNPWLSKELPYNAEKDFAMVTKAAITPNIVAVHPSLPVKSLKELIALAKSNPDQLSYASGGNGTSHHLCGELLKISAGIKMVHIPYKGIGPAQQDLRSGRVPVMCDNFSNLIALVRSGHLRALALTDTVRHPQAPDIPTTAEAGLPGLQAGVWFGFAAPAGTPQPVIARLNTEIINALRSSEAAGRIADLGLTVIGDSPESFTRFVARDATRWRDVVKTAGIRAD